MSVFGKYNDIEIDDFISKTFGEATIDITSCDLPCRTDINRKDAVAIVLHLMTIFEIDPYFILRQINIQ